ncbi:MAG TPA: alpha/beta hydrolase [Gemmatimonadaceae bacterium]
MRPRRPPLDEYNALNPARVHSPTLLIQGAHDPLARTAARQRFFTRLGTTDRTWVTIEGGDHAAILENTQPDVLAAVVDFLQRPSRMRSHSLERVR